MNFSEIFVREKPEFFFVTQFDIRNTYGLPTKKYVIRTYGQTQSSISQKFDAFLSRIIDPYADWNYTVFDDEYTAQEAIFGARDSKDQYGAKFLLRYNVSCKYRNNRPIDFRIEDWVTSSGDIDCTRAQSEKMLDTILRGAIKKDREFSFALEKMDTFPFI